MSDNVLIAFIAVLPATVAAIVGAVTSISNHFQGKVIHTLVNSNLQAVKTDLEIALARIEVLERHIVSRGLDAAPPD